MSLFNVGIIHENTLYACSEITAGSEQYVSNTGKLFSHTAADGFIVVAEEAKGVYSEMLTARARQPFRHPAAAFQYARRGSIETIRGATTATRPYWSRTAGVVGGVLGTSVVLYGTFSALDYFFNERERKCIPANEFVLKMRQGESAVWNTYPEMCKGNAAKERPISLDGYTAVYVARGGAGQLSISNLIEDYQCHEIKVFNEVARKRTKSHNTITISVDYAKLHDVFVQLHNIKEDVIIVVAVQD
jgi:hypothetical protein